MPVNKDQHDHNGQDCRHDDLFMSFDVGDKNKNNVTEEKTDDGYEDAPYGGIE
jgi:hypothetical protein